MAEREAAKRGNQAVQVMLLQASRSVGQGRSVSIAREQPDADHGLQHDAPLHRFVAIRAFWSASSPTHQMMSAPSSASTALSERLSSTTS